MNGYKDDEEEPQLLGDLTPGTSQQVAPVALQPPPSMAPLSMASVPKPQAIPQAQPAPAPQLPGMPPNMTPDQLTSYLGGMKSNLQKFGPDQQMDLEKHLMDQRNSLGYKATDAGKGFADALMQGVARAGNPGWQQQFENQNLAQGQEQMGVMQKAHEQQLQDTEGGMKLDMINPKSPISQAYRESFGPIFSKMGYSPKDVSKMSASQVATVADMGVRFADAQTQLELKKAMLGVQTIQAQATIENQKLQRLEAEQKLGAEHPIQRILGTLPKIAGSDNSSSAQIGPYGQTVKRDGKTYAWSSISNKYHPVK